MKTEEELRAEYRRQRQELEEQAEDIHRFQQKGEEISQQTYEAILYQIRQKEEDCTDILAMARREIEQLEANYQADLQEKKREVRIKTEHIEEQFYKELQQLERNK
ncbi:hypothetical protein [Listeria welshimeri]|uniref:Uncharacterized protein n=1 Tax=Listeria welshimeri TaxID=1643 RepID=A0A7X0T5K7_LISWE|nr:hypothetical protein [Listeria welshimeri]MBC1318595.1 hypothetical protein [Listeria welshimeri]MBC1323003.1 hypothetical protein [Listeria welshimeri]MBC1360238.1 hypothetical protein [Listeria welshimeri]MBC1389346.1 hypothetical protein [Listeria welshimeri]MBC1954985.1 hypothetical protein [Listeria welshimeri]